MSEDDEAQPPNIIIEPEKLAGVWANYARVSHSPYEFTLDFARLDFTSGPPFQGIVVARVSVSPLLVQQLIDALGENWIKFAQKSLPREVYGHGADPEVDDDGEHQEPSA